MITIALCQLLLLCARAAKDISEETSRNLLKLQACLDSNPDMKDFLSDLIQDHKKIWPPHFYIFKERNFSVVHVFKNAGTAIMKSLLRNVSELSDHNNETIYLCL